MEEKIFGCDGKAGLTELTMASGYNKPLWNNKKKAREKTSREASAANREEEEKRIAQERYMEEDGCEVVDAIKI